MPDSQDRILDNGFNSPSDPFNLSIYRTQPSEHDHHHVNHDMRPGGAATQRRQEAPSDAVQNRMIPPVAAVPRYEQGYAPDIGTNSMQPALRNGSEHPRERPRRSAAELAEHRTAQIFHYEHFQGQPLTGVVETPSQTQLASRRRPYRPLAEVGKDDKKFILKKESMTSGLFKRARTSMWMHYGSPFSQETPHLTCVLKTDGLKCHIGKKWTLPLDTSRTSLIWTEMTGDLCLKVGDIVTLKYAEGAAGLAIAHVYIKKKRTSLVTPMGQGTVPVAVADTPNGANTSAAAAVAAARAAATTAGASPSGSKPAGKKRKFHTKEQSQRRQVQKPARAAANPISRPQQRQVENPAPVNAPPPPPVAPAPTAAANATAPSRIKLPVGADRRRRMIDILKRHNVPDSTIERFQDMYFEILREDWDEIYNEIAASDAAGKSETVKKLAEQWADEYTLRKTQENQ